jgi:glutathione S-transferase
MEKGVILDYLARETGHFEGRTEQERWQAREWHVFILAAVN